MSSTRIGTGDAPGPAPAPAPSRDRALLCAVATSSLLALVGAWSLAGPRSRPYDDAQQALARLVLGPTAVPVVLVAAAVVGTIAAVVGLTARNGAGTVVVTVVGALEVVVLGVGMQSVATIALLGYLLALALPAALLGAVVLVCVRHWRVASPIALVALGAVGWGAEVGPPAGLVIGSLVRDVTRGFVDAAPVLVTTTAVTAAAAAWSWVLVGRLVDAAVGRRVGYRVVQHRRLITMLAAVGPLPYVLVRATWLTPWPLAAPGSAELTPELRLFGLLLAGAALLGLVLTLGLVLPWGRTVPAWLPAIGGRPVPVAAAVVPGGIVAGVLTASSAPMLRAIWAPEPGTVFDSSTVEQLAATVLFPFWFWGPALALAVWGYALARQAPDDGAADREP